MVVDFKIMDAVVVEGGGLSGRVIIPQTHLKNDEGRRFIHLSTVPRYSVSLFGRGRDNVNASCLRPLSRTDVFEQLTNKRNLKIDEALGAITHQQGAPIEVLAAFSTKASTPKRLKIGERSQLAESLEIDAPQINDVPGITMNVLTHTKRSPLYIELTSENLAYVRAACISQMDAGDVQRHRAPKVKKIKFGKRRSKPHEEATNSTIDIATIDIATSSSSSTAPPEQLTPEKLAKRCAVAKITQFFKSTKRV
jgi:hypothetical protein